MKVKRNLIHTSDLFKDLGATKIIKINPKDIIVSEWVRIKCMYGCPDYGDSFSCPPHSPDLDYIRRFFYGYSSALLFQFDLKMEDKEKRYEWSKNMNNKLLEIEREFFLKGNQKAWIFFVGCCKTCNDCAVDKEFCIIPEKRRATLESFGVDVFGTVKKYGIHLEVRTSKDQPYKYFTVLLLK